MANDRYPARKRATRPRGVVPSLGPQDMRGIPRFNPSPMPSTGVSGNARSVQRAGNSNAAGGRQAGSNIRTDSFGNNGHTPAFGRPSSPDVRQQAGLTGFVHPIVTSGTGG